jgi:hypothetical protein
MEIWCSGYSEFSSYSITNYLEHQICTTMLYICYVYIFLICFIIYKQHNTFELQEVLQQFCNFNMNF